MSLQEGSKIPQANALQALLLKYWGHKVKCKSILDSPENNSTLLYSTLHYLLLFHWHRFIVDTAAA